MKRLSSAQGETLEQRMARLSTPKPEAPAERPPLWDRIKETGRAIADDPMGAVKSIGKGLAGNVGDAGAMLAAAGGNYTPLYDEIAKEAAKGEGVEKRLLARGVGAASLMVPAVRVGGVATSALLNTAANAGLGAAQTPDDPMLGAVLGAAVPASISATSKLARGAVGKLGKAVRPLDNLNLEGATDGVLAGVDAGQRNSIPKRRPTAGVKIQPEKIDALAEVGNQNAIDEILSGRIERGNAALDEATVTPTAMTAREAALQRLRRRKAYPQGYSAELDAMQAEVRAVPGQKKLFVDPEVKASRVEGEKLDIAEQRDAENRMVKDAKALDKEAADAEAQAVKDAEKAAKDSDKAQKAAENTLKTQQAKAAREAEKAANLAEKAAVAAAKAAKRQSDAAALTAAQAVGKDAVKEVRARQAAEKAAERAADAQAKADFATQAALDAQAKRQMADEAANLTVADVAPVQAVTSKVAPIETASGMLGVANARYNRTQRGKLAAQAALARRKGAAVEPQDVPAIAPESPVTPQNPPAIVRQGSARAKAYADEYNATRPDYKDELPRVEKVDEEFAKKVAAWYDGAQSTVDDPATRAAYRALANETRQQAEFLKSKGVKFEYVTEDPYPNSAAMMKDVEENGVLKVFKTPDDFNHPLLSAEENDLFRAIHDYFGHAKEGHQFGPKGEENAYRVHSSMFSPEARKAMATETRGQNSWVNYGPYGEANRANPKNTKFADQKTVLMPDEFLGDYGQPPRPPAPPAAGNMPPSLPPADKPFINWRTLGVDPSKPDVLNKSVSARIQEKMRDPAFVDEMRAARGSTTFGAMNEEAMKSKFIKDFVADPASIDPKKVARLSGAEIAAIKPLLRENVALIESISRELQDGNLSADDIALAHQKIDMLEEANANTLLVIQQEGSARGRDLGALRQIANMTTDPAYWLMKAQRALGDKPMSKDVVSTIMRLAKEAAEACGGG